MRLCHIFCIDVIHVPILNQNVLISGFWKEEDFKFSWYLQTVGFVKLWIKLDFLAVINRLLITFTFDGYQLIYRKFGYD